MTFSGTAIGKFGQVVFRRAALLDFLLDLLHVALTASGGDADHGHKCPFMHDKDVLLHVCSLEETRISNQTDFPPTAVKKVLAQIYARLHIRCQTSQTKTTSSLLSSLSLFSPVYTNKSILSGVLLPFDLLFREAVWIIDERLSLVLSASNVLHGLLNAHRALHVIHDPSSG